MVLSEKQFMGGFSSGRSISILQPDCVAMETRVECKVRQVLLPEAFLDMCVWRC